MGLSLSLKKLGQLKGLVSLVVFLLLPHSFALKSIKLSNGRYIALETHLITNKKNKPTLIFLPSIYRGWSQQDRFIQILKKEKVSFIALNFSLHPESILAIPTQETPFVNTHSYTQKDLADEIDAVVRKFEIKKPILVSFSYSSIITTALSVSKKYPFIVETSPMIRYDDNDPSGGQINDFWQNFFNLSPFSGPIITKWYLNQIYTQHWAEAVAKLLLKHPEYAAIQETMISSYTEMSMLAHGFDFNYQNFIQGPKRLFILGENEENYRFERQLKASQQYELTSKDPTARVIFKNAGHLVPHDAPEQYVDLLKQFISE